MSEFNGINKKIVIGLVGLAVVILIIVLVAAFKFSSTSDLPVENELTAPETQETVVGYEWPAYTEPGKKYTLLYPDSWLVQATDPNDTSILSLTNGQDFALNLDRYPAKVVMSVSVVKTGTSSLEAFLKTQAPASERALLKTSVSATLSGLDVVRVSNETAKTPYVFYAVKLNSSEAVLLEAYGYLQNQAIDALVKSVALPQ